MFGKKKRDCWYLSPIQDQDYFVGEYTEANIRAYLGAEYGRCKRAGKLVEFWKELGLSAKHLYLVKKEMRAGLQECIMYLQEQVRIDLRRDEIEKL